MKIEIGQEEDKNVENKDQDNINKMFRYKEFIENKSEVIICYMVNILCTYNI